MHIARRRTTKKQAIHTYCRVCMRVRVRGCPLYTAGVVRFKQRKQRTHPSPALHQKQPVAGAQKVTTNQIIIHKFVSYRPCATRYSSRLHAAWIGGENNILRLDSRLSVCPSFFCLRQVPNCFALRCVKQQQLQAKTDLLRIPYTFSPEATVSVS